MEEDSDPYKNSEENDCDSIMDENSPKGRADQGNRQNDADKHPKPINWKKVRRIAAIVGIIEVVSLVLWQEADEFNGFTAELIHWISKCGVLAGGAFIAHKSSKNPIPVWSSYALLCLCMLRLSSTISIMCNAAFVFTGKPLD